MNRRTDSVISTGVYVAHSFWQKFRGLMGTSTLSKDEGMLFPRTHAVHMFFMRYPLLIVYLSTDFTVLQMIELNPWEVSPIVWDASWVLELPTSKNQEIFLGDTLQIFPTILAKSPDNK
ncbi:hypothetical protein BM613_00315 [Sulfoacidibacillus thermotolerans]|uniref:DUF192 domain-containing protein n=1 Tax=Sulfoacidibacillus thermotolerans TaxID=1765684 RepID=A0A2U3DCT8_SULT2|nr:hypothetical protein BM613_00315 [Sulfoacidibacillus thermotolerans]